jgi:general secretion pathway protein G
MSILKKESGFTLVEIIVVAAIIAVLAGILIPMIFSQIDEAKLATLCPGQFRLVNL